MKLEQSRWTEGEGWSTASPGTLAATAQLVLVFGGTSGINLGIAEAFANAGASTLSRSYRGVQPLQLNAGVGCGELPIRFGVVLGAAVLPGGDFLD